MYEWILVAHIISIIAWMAGLLYLPRLFVYHVNADIGSELSETLKVMEYRLFHFIMMPAMTASWLFGLWLVNLLKLYNEGWFNAKILLVVFLTITHVAMSNWRKDFVKERNTKSENFFKIVNEVPTMLMIGIVILVILKPF